MSLIEPFPQISPRLNSLTESVRICPGFQLGDEPEDCGDELEPGKELCPTHQRDEDRYYDRKAREAHGVEEFVAYPHLTD